MRCDLMRRLCVGSGEALTFARVVHGELALVQLDRSPLLELTFASVVHGELASGGPLRVDADDTLANPPGASPGNLEESH